MARKIIIDTDPGKDDAIAILLALSSPEDIEVIGVTTVAGNVAVEKTTRNALILCEMAGRADIPVHAGCDTPLARKLVTAEHIHGATGLDGIALRPPRAAPAPGHAVDFIVETLRREAEGAVSLVAIGPLTNIATAIDHAPDIVSRIGEIVVMGGAGRVAGNVTPVAEFNIHADPEAAQAVFTCGARLVLFPLDVTCNALADRAWVEGFANAGTRIGAAIASWVVLPEGDGGPAPGAPLHDPCTVAWLLQPQLFTTGKVNAMVETKGEFTTGMTVIDWAEKTGRAANCRVASDVDRDALFAFMAERLGRYGQPGRH